MTGLHFLYDDYDSISKMNMLSKEIPGCIKDNLDSKYLLRPYQIEAFSRFIHYYENYPNKEYPIHLMFNMATGSGKTLIMAGLILYLYQRGFNNFVFFVNSTNIIEKTKANFLDNGSSKYLFNNKISFDDKIVNIKEVSNFSNEVKDTIQIKFTTIQGLHSDMNNPKENSLTYEDFENQKIVIISDEAHHINSDTKKNLTKDEKENVQSWESTVMKLLNANKDNIMLEFTATIDFNDSSIVNKYLNKIIFKYDLKQFRLDKYSKDVDIMKSEGDNKTRMLQAVIMSQYRLKIAEKNKIYCKPVILFKAQKTIADSEKNMQDFIDLIKNLKPKEINDIKNASKGTPLLETAFTYFLENNITIENLIKEIQEDFSEDKCISANDDAEASKNQILLNTLEEKDNPIRAIFAVQKLNEGWDVLNLFDIVRLYESRSNVLRDGRVVVGPQTMSEAQLIGRGARYFPFAIAEGEDKFTRKYDNSINELKILETFLYHTSYDNQYITEIKQALREIGIMEENEKNPFSLKLKDKFTKSDFYKNGYIYVNERIEDLSENDDLLKDLMERFNRELRSNRINIISAFDDIDNKEENDNLSKETKSIKISEFHPSIIRKALCIRDFFNFNNLKKYLPNINSIKDFSDHYLGSIIIDFRGTKERLGNITPDDKLESLLGVLSIIENILNKKETSYKGTKEFKPKALKSLFAKEKVIYVDLNSVQEISDDHDWFVFEKIKGTSEEKSFIEFFGKKVNELKDKYDDIYLLRSERAFALYSFKDGRRFEPDFVLFLRNKDTQQTITYQMFIEPKGNQFKDEDGKFDKGGEGWKQEFLLEIEDKHEIIDFNFGDYKLIGLPFYNKDLEKDFEKAMDEKI